MAFSYLSPLSVTSSSCWTANVSLYVFSVVNFTVQETLPSQESLDHSVKHDEDNEEEIPRTTAKRKRSSSKGRVSILHYWFHV